MATKKQKRLAGEAKHARHMAELRQTGLAAQARDRAERFREQLALWQEGHDKKHHRFVDECPHCQVIRSALAQGKTAKEAKEDVEGIMSRRLTAPPTIDLNGFSLPGDLNVAFSNSAELEDASSFEMECI